MEKYVFYECRYDLIKIMLKSFILMILNIIVNKKIDPIEIINNKIDKNEKKYPIEKAKGVSTKYNKL